MPDDFVETNIIIGYTVAWDRHSSVVQTYLDSRAPRANVHTCLRVVDEAEDVVNERRRLAKQAARLVFQDCEAGNEHPPVAQLVGFVRRELSDARDAVVDHVIQHIEDDEFYYAGLTQTESPSALAGTVEDIDSDFDDVIAVIQSIRAGTCSELDCAVFTDGLQDYRTYDVFTDVDSVLAGSPTDRDILLDSFHLSQELGLERLYFVPMDGHFLANEPRLESLLDPIDIEPPESLS